jgi:very-short-patch-repair endonuclease
MDLLDIAHRGVFKAADALGAGIDGQQLTRLLAQGACTRLTHGWYSLGRPRDDVERHRLTAFALATQYAGRALPSHHTAVLLAGLPIHGVGLDVVHLTRLESTGRQVTSGQSGRRTDLRLHRSMPGVEAARAVRHGDGPDLVPIEHAIVGAGIVGSPLTALVAADAALTRGLVTAAGLDSALCDFRERHGVGVVRAVLPFADGRHESPAETVTAHVLRRLGYVTEPQFAVATEGRVYRADLRIVGTRVLVEFDGRVKYREGDVTTLFDEKRREDALRRAGWVVVRLVWQDLRSADVVRQRIEAALRLATQVA